MYVRFWWKFKSDKSVSQSVTRRECHQTRQRKWSSATNEIILRKSPRDLRAKRFGHNLSELTMSSHCLYLAVEEMQLPRQAGRQAGYSWTGGGLRPTNRAAGWLKIVSNGNRRRSGGFRFDDDNSSDCALLFALNGVCSSRASKLRILVFSRILTG